MTEKWSDKLINPRQIFDFKTTQQLTKRRQHGKESEKKGKMVEQIRPTTKLEKTQILS